MKIYMLVTRDKFELPLVIADTARELAEKTGTTVNCINSSISRAKSEGYHSQYVKVEL